MGLLNLLTGGGNARVQDVMKKEAKRLADWAWSTHSVVKRENPTMSEQDILFDMLTSEVALKPGSEQRMRNNVCISIQSLCYFMGLTVGPFKGWDNFRSLQFTQHMDAALRERGFRPQSGQTQKQALLNRGFPEQHIDQVIFGR